MKARMSPWIIAALAVVLILGVGVALGIVFQGQAPEPARTTASTVPWLATDQIAVVVLNLTSMHAGLSFPVGIPVLQNGSFDWNQSAKTLRIQAPRPASWASALIVRDALRGDKLAAFEGDNSLLHLGNATETRNLMFIVTPSIATIEDNGSGCTAQVQSGDLRQTMESPFTTRARRDENVTIDYADGAISSCPIATLTYTYVGTIPKPM